MVSENKSLVRKKIITGLKKLTSGFWDFAKISPKTTGYFHFNWLKEYQSKLILFPVNSKKPRKGEATEEDIKKASQLAGQVIPIKPVVKRQRAMELTDDLKNFKAFNSVRQARAVARLWGIRAKKAKEAEADDLSKPAKKCCNKNHLQPFM